MANPRRFLGKWACTIKVQPITSGPSSGGDSPNSWRWTSTRASSLSLTQQKQLTDEVWEAICGLNAEGAAGTDGIPVFFYKNCWARVGPDVMALLEEFHAGTCPMGRINWAYIMLLPKIFGAERVGHFRPISLSNNIYLIIVKVLANRLRGLLGTFISPLQSAFVPGRQMSDSVVVAEEIIADWRRLGTARFVWKVNFTKAYDSLELVFPLESA